MAHEMDPGQALGLRAWIPSPRRLRQLLAAGMLGAAAFLVEAGAAELVLRADRLCRELRLEYWAFNPAGCQPEVVVRLLAGLARGPVGAVRPDLPPVLGVASMAVLTSLMATLLGFLPARRAVPLFVAMQLLAMLACGLIGFILSYTR